MTVYKKFTKEQLKQVLVLVNLGIWLLFFGLFWVQGYTFKADGSVWAKSLGTWADGAAHLTYISAMATRIPLESPIYLGKAFTYPFVADLLSAILVRLGINIFLSYAWVGLILSAILVYSLYRLYLYMFKSRFVSLVGLHIFLLSGGMGFVKFFRDLIDKGSEVLTAIPQEYTLIEEWHIRWINIVTAELIPQRAFLLAIPLGIVVLYWMWQVYTEKPVKFFLTLLSGFLMGIMPLIHAHTYIVFGVISLWVLGLSLLNHRQELSRGGFPKIIKHWLIYGIVAAVLSLPILFWHILPATDQSFTKWYPGWLAKSMQVNWWWWWFINTGFFWPVALIGWLHASPRKRFFFASFWIVFIIANLFLFQPYDWDNAKLLTWSILGLAPMAALALYQFWNKGIVFKLLSISLFVSLTLSGVIDVFRQLQPHVSIRMYTQEELELVNWVKQNTPSEAIFLTSQQHTHPISVLAGRQIVMGYQGWLWSYGINYTERENDIMRIYQTADDQLLRTYKINYVVVGPDEKHRFQPMENLFSQKYPLVHTTLDYHIYRIP